MSGGKHRYADRRLWWFRTWELVRAHPAYHAELYRYWLRQDAA
jgi:hypothetical protein